MTGFNCTITAFYPIFKSIKLLLPERCLVSTCTVFGLYIFYYLQSILRNDYLLSRFNNLDFYFRFTIQ